MAQSPQRPTTPASSDWTSIDEFEPIDQPVMAADGWTSVDEFEPVDESRVRRGQPGNIDLYNRPPVSNDDGTTSTVRSISFNEDGHEILIPTVIQNRVVSDDEAIAEYHRTHQHLGIFDTVDEANAAAKQIHEDYERGTYDRHGLLEQLVPPVRSTPGDIPPPQDKPIDAWDSVKRRGTDVGIMALKGAISLPETLSGLLGGPLPDDPFTVDTGLAKAFQPAKAKAILDTYYTPEEQQAFANVEHAQEAADTLWGKITATTAAMLENPSTIADSLIESAPVMFAGGPLAKALPFGAAVAGGLSEGILQMGGAAAQSAQTNPNGQITPSQRAIAASSGLITGALGVLGGRVAKFFGLEDIDTLIARSARDPNTAAQTIYQALGRMGGGALVEGLFEELPQSLQEQWHQNIADGKPWYDGLVGAGVAGMLTGGVMGAMANVGSSHPPVAGPATTPPPAGGFDLPLQNYDPNAPVPPPAPPPVAPVAGPVTTPPASAPAATPGPPNAPPVAPPPSPVPPSTPQYSQLAFERLEAGQPLDDVDGLSPSLQRKLAVAYKRGLIDSPEDVTRLAQLPAPELNARIAAAKPVGATDTPAQPQPARPPIDLTGMGDAVADNLYQRMLDRVLAGKPVWDMAEKPPLPEQIVQHAADNGLIETIDDVKRFARMSIEEARETFTPTAETVPTPTETKSTPSETESTIPDTSGQPDTVSASKPIAELSDEELAAQVIAKVAAKRAAKAAAQTPVPNAANPAAPDTSTTNKTAEINTPKSSPASGFTTSPETTKQEVSPSGKHYDYSSTQVNLPPDVGEKVQALGAAIPDADLAEDGLETDPHVTVKYGLTSNDVEPVRQLLAGQPPITVTFGTTSVFPDSGNGDVVKVDIDSPQLHALNKKIAGALEHEDTHPTYVPHATVAYVKPGLGKKYAGNDALKGTTTTIDHLTFTAKDGTVHDIPLTGEDTSEEAWWAREQERIAARKARSVTLAETNHSVRLKHPTSGHSAIAGPDMSKPGRSRVTHFDSKGEPFGHTEYTTLDKAIDAALAEGYETQGDTDARPEPTDRGAEEAARVAREGRSQKRRDAASDRAREEAAQRTAETLDRIVEKAVKAGYTENPDELRVELNLRLLALREWDSSWSDSGQNPTVLLKAVAAAGGLSIKNESAQKAEIDRLRGFGVAGTRDSRPVMPFGMLGGIRGVFNEGGLSLDGMVEALGQDPRFPHIASINDLMAELETAAKNVDESREWAKLERGLGRDWWQHITKAAHEDTAEADGQPIDDSFDTNRLDAIEDDQVDAFTENQIRGAGEFPFPTMPEADIFPAPTDAVTAKDLAANPQLTPAEAQEIIESWKREAARVGEEEDHSNEVVYSLFDKTGGWAAPWVDAGYDVRLYDITNGHDLLEFFPVSDILEDLETGKEVVGVLAAPPCTSLAVSGARWWANEHDKADVAMVEKKYGFRASRDFDTPLDYANTLVRAAELFISFANPSQFHAMENPVGRIATENNLPKPRLGFDPNHFGDPYTKKTFLWGVFNPNLPTAHVEPTKGSYIATLRGDNPAQKAERSTTPEGFSYAFFMANHRPGKPAGAVSAHDKLEAGRAAIREREGRPSLEAENAQQAQMEAYEAIGAIEDQIGDATSDKEKKKLTAQRTNAIAAYEATYDETYEADDKDERDETPDTAQADPDSRYAGDNLADLTAAVLEEQRGRYQAIVELRDDIVNVKKAQKRSPEQQKKLQDRLGGATAVYDGTYEELRDAGGDPDQMKAIVEHEGRSDMQPHADEPAIGSAATFKHGKTGIVQGVITAGTKGGTGIHALRRRVQVLFTDKKTGEQHVQMNDVADLVSTKAAETTSDEGQTARDALKTIRAGGFEPESYDEEDHVWILEPNSVSDAGRAVGRDSKRKPSAAVRKALDAWNQIPMDVAERILNEPEARTGVDTLDTGEQQPRLPEAAGVRQVGEKAPGFRAPQQASGEDFDLTSGQPPVDDKQPGMFDAPEQPAAPTPAAAPKPTVTINDRGSIEIKFPAKPAEPVLDDVKRAGFKWAKSNRTWYRRLTGASASDPDAALKAIREMVGAVTLSSPTTNATLGRELSAKTWYHGSGGGTDVLSLRAPVFLTTSTDGADWYAQNRGDGKQVIFKMDVAVTNPFPIRNYDDAVRLRHLLVAAGIDVTLDNGPTGWTWSVPSVAEHSDYEGDNPIDVVYMAKARAALRAAGYDALYSPSDPLLNGEIEALVPLGSPVEQINHRSAQAAAVPTATPTTEKIDTRPTYEDGRLIPIVGDEVYQPARGFGGSVAYIHGTVYGKSGKLRVQITGSASLVTGGRVSGAPTRTLDASWTVQGDPEVARREAARDAKEKAEKAQYEQEHKESVDKIAADATKQIADEHGTTLTADTPIGSRVYDHWQQGWAKVTGHASYGPLLTAEQREDGYDTEYTIGKPNDAGVWDGFAAFPPAEEADKPSAEPTDAELAQQVIDRVEAKRKAKAEAEASAAPKAEDDADDATTELTGQLWRGELDKFSQNELAAIAREAASTVPGLKTLAVKGGTKLADRLDAHEQMIAQVIRGIVTTRARAKPTTETAWFDADAWDAKERAIEAAVNASKAAGHTHLDQMPQGVEALRGRRFTSLRDHTDMIVTTVGTDGFVRYVEPDGSKPNMITGKELAEFVLQPSSIADLAIAIKANIGKKASWRQLKDAATRYGFAIEPVPHGTPPRKQTLATVNTTPKTAPELPPQPLSALEQKKADIKAQIAKDMADLKADLKNTLGAGLNPKHVEGMIKITRGYIKLGMVNAQEVWEAFAEQFGEGYQALREHFETAWEMLTGNEVSVADIPAEAETTGESTDGEEGRPQVDGTGRRDESGGAPADGDRGGGPDVLAPVSPETLPVAQSAGSDKPGLGDPQGVTPDGVPDGPDSGGVAEAPPGAGAETHPVPSLPVSGTAHNPGPRHADYQLTPERIAAIVGRTDMPRAKDNLAAMRLAKILQREQRLATPEEQDLLAKYVGWGATEMAALLAPQPNEDWSGPKKALWQQIQDETTQEQRDALTHSAQNAHFTYDLYGPIWAALERAGFTGGRILEPAVGTGHAFGLMPAQMRHDSTLNATELEPITATIAQALYPSARVQTSGYEKARIPRGTQDLVISNVPFGKYPVIDALMPQAVRARIHNYFFGKALEHVRPGGLVVFVTSRYTLDGTENRGARRYLMERAHFIGAVRLPNTAFDKTAKTEVVTDLIVLQRFAPGETEARNKDAFLQSAPIERFAVREPKYKANGYTREHNKDGTPAFTTINVYRSTWYNAHPELLLGTEAMVGKQHKGGEYAVVTKDTDIRPAFTKALEQILPPGTYTPGTAEVVAPLERAEGAFKPGEYRVGKTPGSIQQVNKDGDLVDKPLTAKVATILTKQIGIRDALRATVAAMRSPTATDAAIAKTQAVLLARYTAFTQGFETKPGSGVYAGGHGDLNDRANKTIFSGDPEAANLLGLEVVKPSATPITNKKGVTVIKLKYKVVGLADIFTKRTLNAPKEITHVETTHEALLASLGRNGRIDWRYMARIYSGSESKAAIANLKETLKTAASVFETPEGVWQLADEYLSGDVVTKLADAVAAADTEPARYKVNVDALTAAQPAPKTDDDLINGTVSITLGSHWIPTDDIEQFIQDELQYGTEPAASVGLVGSEAFTHWDVRFTDRAVTKGQNHPLAVKYGQRQEETFGFTDLLAAALNLDNPDLGYYIGRGKDREYIKDPVGTLAARANVEEVRSRWTQWLYEHPDVMTRLLAEFNDRYNRTAERTYDGGHLVNYTDWNDETKSGTRTAALPGLSLLFPLFKHQLRAIWRALTTGNTLLAHAVGAGKTFEMIVIAMEMRRSGRARKPMITVPTHLLGQWRQDILKAYPDAKLLAFDEDDLDKPKRQEAMARIAYGDWDIVLVPHSSFKLLQVSDQRMIDTMQEWISQMMDAEMEARDRSGKADLSVKKMAAKRASIQAKVDAKLAVMNQSDDRNLTWEQLGVDALLVDEAHAFKNLYFFSKIENMRGLSRAESDQALGLSIKVKDINEASNYRNLVFATATPVMNTMAEVFTMQRYLQPHRLADAGFDNFDNWYAAFAQATAAPEQQPNGSYKEVQRIREFRNLNLLYRTFVQVMDYVGMSDMPYLKLPKLTDDKITIIKTPEHPMYEELRRWFGDRMANVEAMPPHVDNEGRYIAPLRPDPLTGAPMPQTDPHKAAAMGPFKQDNILTIMNDARLAAIDVRLILGNRATDYPGSRVQVAAQKMVQFYKAEKDKRGVSLVFLDVGTPKDPGPLEFLRGATVDDSAAGGSLGVEDEIADDNEAVLGEDESGNEFNLYDALKGALVARGVPSHEIAYIHQAKNDAERVALFEAARNGTVRFLFASTDKGGVGMNIQDRLGMLVEMDAPRAMRPGDIIQRHGRIIRQGNSYKYVSILRMITEGSTDEWLYGMLAQKSALVESFMRGTATSFVEPDASNRSIPESQLLASGDPRAVELITLRTTMPRLASQAIAQQRAQSNARTNVDYQQRRIESLNRTLQRLRSWITPNWVDLKGDAFTMTVGKKTYAKRVDANTALLDAAGQMVDRETTATTTIGTIGGLDIQAEWHRETKDLIKGYLGIGLDADPLGEGGISIASIEPNEDPTIRFGAGRNIVQSLTDRYSGLPDRIVDAEHWLKEAQEQKKQSEAVLARPADAIEKAEKVRTRINELEAAIALTSAAKDIAETAARKARLEAQAAKAAKAAAKALNPPEPPIPPGEDPNDDRWADDGGHGRESDRSQGDGMRRRRVADEEDPNPGLNPDVDIDESIPVRRATDPSGRALAPIEVPELVALANELSQTPTVPRSFRSGARGDFGGGAIRIAAWLFKRGNERQLAATLAHEIGHLIDWLPSKTLKRGNLLGRLRTLDHYLKGTFTTPDGRTLKNAAIRKELYDLSMYWRPWDPDTATAGFKAYRKSGKELYADALSVLLNNPGLLKSDAPLFFQAFFAGLTEKPDVRIAFEALQDLLTGTPDELASRRRQRTRANFVAGDAKAVEVHEAETAAKVEAPTDAWLHLQTLHRNIDMPIIARVQKDVAGGAIIHPDDDPRYALSERNHTGSMLQGFTKTYYQPIVEALADADIDWDTFGESLMYRRILEGDRTQVANPDGLAPDDIPGMLANLERPFSQEKLRVLREQTRAFHRVTKLVAEEGYTAGLYTDTLYQQMLDNPAYVPFQVIEHMDDGVTAAVYRQKGTLKAIANPATTAMLKVHATLRAIDRNNVRRKVFNLLERYHRNDIEQAREVHEKRGMKPVPPEYGSKLKLVTYKENGRTRGKYVDAYVADSLENNYTDTNHAILHSLRFINSYLLRPLFTTYSIGFQTVNPFKDLGRTWANTPRVPLGQLLKRYAQAIPAARVRAFDLPKPGTRRFNIFSDATLEQAEADVTAAELARILPITYNDLNQHRTHEDTQIDELLVKMGVMHPMKAAPPPWATSSTTGLRKAGEVLHAVAHTPVVAVPYSKAVRPVLDFISNAGKFFETLPKMAGVYEYRGTGEIADIPADLRFQVRSNMGTPDGMQRGKLTPITNELLLFSNIAIQGISTDAAIARDPTTAAGWWWKRAAMNILPKLVQFALLYGTAATAIHAVKALARGGAPPPPDDDDDWVTQRFLAMQRAMRSVSEYDLTNKINLPIWHDAETGNTGYIPFGTQDETGRLLGGITWKALRAAHGDQDVMASASQVLEYMTGIAPSLAPTITAAVDSKDFITGKNIRDPFTGRDLYSDREMLAGRSLPRFVGYEFLQMGGGAIWKFYPGDERPRDRSIGQVILELPPIATTTARWFKITNYGQIEKLRDATKQQAVTEAKAGEARDDKLSDAIRQYRETPPMKRLPGLLPSLARTVTADEPPARRAAAMAAAIKAIRQGEQRGSGDPLTNVVIGARSNAQKVAAIVDRSRTIPPAELEAWLNQAVQARTISGQLAHDARAAVASGRR